MTKKNKVLEIFLVDPIRLKYSQIENLLQAYGFEVIQAKGSHKKIVYVSDPFYFTIVPIHNNDCFPIYKENLKKLYLSTKKIGDK